jgi:hypothetical protein
MLIEYKLCSQNPESFGERNWNMMKMLARDARYETAVSGRAKALLFSYWLVSNNAAVFVHPKYA